MINTIKRTSANYLHLVSILLISLPLALVAHAEEKAESTPLENFYQLPILTNVRISPDGNYLLALKNFGSETAVMTLNTNTGEVFYPSKTDNKKFKFSWVDWANDDRLIMSVLFAEGEFGISVKISYSRMLGIDAKHPSKIINLIKPKESDPFVASSNPGQASQFQDNVIGKIPSDPNSVLVSLDDKIPNHPTVYSVNVNTGKMKTVKVADSSINWWVDRQGNVRIGEIYDDRERKFSYKILDLKTNNWVKAWEYVEFESPSITPLGFGKNPNDLYLLADHDGTQALYKADLSKEGFPWQLLLSSPDRDIEARLIYSEKYNDVVGIYYNDGEEKSVFFNDDLKKFQASLNKALPNSTNYIVDMSSDGNKYIVSSSSDVNPGTLYFGNRETKELSKIADQFPKLKESDLVKKEFVVYKARDGLELGGYLSKPKNGSTKPLATIIYPHGGPMAEDGADFDEFASFFVSRGYAVFQPNYRGSTGRGFEFQMKAVGAYGLSMQDDIEDAVKFLVDTKVTDPKRVGIVGGSYGGYAALLGATKTPDLYQCAISLAGISDMKKLSENSRYYFYKNIFKAQLGTDSDQLKKTSPVRMVDKVKIPILLIHGSDDATVPVVQSRIMADELKDQKKVYEYIELQNGSHHFDYLPHRKQTFEAMDAFLKKYLPAQ